MNVDENEIAEIVGHVETRKKPDYHTPATKVKVPKAAVQTERTEPAHAERSFQHPMAWKPDKSAPWEPKETPHNMYTFSFNALSGTSVQDQIDKGLKESGWGKHAMEGYIKQRINDPPEYVTWSHADDQYGYATAEPDTHESPDEPSEGSESDEVGDEMLKTPAKSDTFTT